MDYTELIINDNYINEMAEYFEKQGKMLQNMADSYIAAMKHVTEEGIITGETADALKLFVQCAKRLNRVITLTSVQIKDSLMTYLDEVDTQDKYLY